MAVFFGGGGMPIKILLEKSKIFFLNCTIFYMNVPSGHFLGNILMNFFLAKRFVHFLRLSLLGKIHISTYIPFFKNNSAIFLPKKALNIRFRLETGCRGHVYSYPVHVRPIPHCCPYGGGILLVDVAAPRVYPRCHVSIFQGKARILLRHLQ